MRMSVHLLTGGYTSFEFENVDWVYKIQNE